MGIGLQGGEGRVRCSSTVCEGPLGIDVGAAGRLGDDLVDDAEGEEVAGPDLHGLGGLLDRVLVLPEDGRAALGADDGVEGVLEHRHRSPMPMPRAPPLPPSPMMTTTIGTRSLENDLEVVGDGLGLAALLGADAGIGARACRSG